MQLKPSSSSDRAWVWSTHADYADEEVKPELLAIRFANAESMWELPLRLSMVHVSLRLLLTVHIIRHHNILV